MSRGLPAKGAHSTGKSIFIFGFDFAEMFGHKVSSAVCSTPRRQLCDRFVNKGYTFRENLRSRMHTAEVCNIPLRQTAHRGVKIEIFSCLWLLLKGQSIENLLGVKEKIWNIKCWFTKNIFVFAVWTWVWASTQSPIVLQYFLYFVINNTFLFSCQKITNFSSIKCCASDWYALWDQ